MTRDTFLATKEEDLTTVRIVSPDALVGTAIAPGIGTAGVEHPFNRLLNTIVAGDGNSFVALEEDAKGASERMIVKLPAKVRRVIQRVSSADGITTIEFQPDVASVAEAKSAKPARTAPERPVATEAANPNTSV